MYIGDYYFVFPTSLMELNATSFYFVAFSFLVFLLSRPFKSILRPYILLIANIIFVYSFGLNNLLFLFIFSLVGYIFSFIIYKYRNKYFVIFSSLLFLASLFIFKYINLNNGSIIIPLGLSFYTFKIISYLVDIYEEKATYEDNFIYYLDYVMFFPCITAGPINRADKFFIEIKSKHEFDYKDIGTGFFQMAIGLFEKLVFCDYIGTIVSRCLNNEVTLTGMNILLGIVLYSFQIYLDFDSYSNIAIGTARMLGFKLDPNFKTPYLATSIKDFWNRWHISLSTWLKDYIYIPLGGSKKGTLRKYINILLVFLVSSLWHGITINFLIWGMGHALFRIIEDIISIPFKKIKINPIFKFIGSIILICINFSIITALWVFFKYSNLNDALNIFKLIFEGGSLNYELIGLTHNEILWMYVVIVTVLIIDILRYFVDIFEFFGKHIFILRFVIYVVLILVFLVFGVYGGSGFDANDFIYRWF